MYRQGDLIRKIDSKTGRVVRQFSFSHVEAEKAFLSLGGWAQARLIADGDSLWAISLPIGNERPAIIRRIEAKVTAINNNEK
jgi:hypothetical protein